MSSKEIIFASFAIALGVAFVAPLAIAQLPSPAAAPQRPGAATQVAAAPQTPVPPSAAAQPTARAGQGGANGDVVLTSAIDAMARHVSVSASIRQQVNLYGQQLFGTGEFWQQGTGPRQRFRLDLSVQGTRQKQSAIRVSDGRILWLLDDLGAQRTLRVVNLRRVEEAARAQREENPSTWRPEDLVFGGLSRLLVSCQENFQFTEAQQSQLGTVPVWVLRGTWQAEKLKKLMAAAATPDKPKAAADARRLPPQVPDEVVIYLGRDELFPHRIEFRSDHSAPKRGAEGSNLVAAMDLFEVQIDVPISEQQFTRPAALPELDDTEAFMKRLGLAVPHPGGP